MKTKKSFYLIFVALFYFADIPIFAQGTGGTNGYHLVWQDLFDGTELSAANWVVEENGNGGGNQELQYYRAGNVSVGIEPASGKSCLILTAKKESFGGKTATSGRINTQGKVYFKHGKLEASIRIPHTANGLWPAFWLLGQDISTNPWPESGEIDVVEMGERAGINAGTQDRFFSGACHWGKVSGGGHPNYPKSTTNPSSLQDDFHLFTLIWDNSYIRMYLDLDKNPQETPYYEMDIRANPAADHPSNYLHKPFFVLFNLAVGGNFPQIWDINQITALNTGNGYEAKMYVDFVKLYQKGLPEENEEITITTGLNPVQKEQAYYRISPNPGNREIRILGPDTPERVTVYSYTGSAVKIFEKTSVLDISDLSDGNYLLKIENRQVSENIRFIKN